MKKSPIAAGKSSFDLIDLDRLLSVLPLKRDSVLLIDLCLMATVLHDLVQDGTSHGALQEIKRVLRPGGTFAVLEFKKIDGPPGPPKAIRLAPEEMERLVSPFGFKPEKTIECGDYHYVSLFTS